MTLITDSEEPSVLGTEIDRVREQLSDIMTEMTAIQTKVREEGNNGVSESAKRLGELRHWIKLAIETEARIEEHRKKKHAIARGYTIDFDEARSTIGCRLDRLRRSCCSKGVSR